jgi:tetratricopeptide (TPR) repeat protein
VEVQRRNVSYSVNEAGGSVRRPSGVTVALLPLVFVLILPTLTNVAAGALPSTWRPYLWIAWPLAALLAVPVIFEEIKKSRASNVVDREAGGSAPERLAHATRRELPRDVPDFTNRDVEMERIAELLGSASAEASTVPVLAIHGMAGVGKTTLAVHAAHRIAPNFPDGQLFVDLHGFAPNAAVEPAEALDTLLRALRVPAGHLPQSLAERASLYRDRLADKRILIVLDNARTEHQVRPLLPGAPGCAVVVTSRAHLAGIEGASHLPLDVLGREEAAELFTKIVGSTRLASEGASVAEVADICGRLALAIRIAGARMATRPRWSAATLARRLHDQQRGITELRVGELDVSVAFSLSYEQLEPVSRRVFRLLGLHPGVSFDAPAAAALGDVGSRLVDEVLDGLVEVHLLDESVAGRYRLHDLLRQYAREVAMAVDSPEDRQAACQRLVSYYLRQAASASHIVDGQLRSVVAPLEPAQAGPGAFETYASALSWFEVERRNLVGSVHVAAELALDEDVWRLAYVMYPYFFLRGFTDDWMDTHELALAATRRLGDPLAEADILFGLGVACRRLGRYQEALDHQQQALTHYREVGNLQGEVRTLTNLGIAYRRLGHYSEALDHHQKALKLHAEVHDRHGEAMALTNLGIVHERLGRYQESLDHHSRALRLARNIGDRHAEAMALTNLGIVYERLGQCDASLQHHRRALILAQDIGDRHVEGHTMNNLGVVFTRMDSRDEAMAHHRAGLELLRKTGSRGDECEALIDTGDLLRNYSERAEALDHYQKAYQLARQIGDPYLEGRAIEGRASVDWASDAPGRRRDWDAALRIFMALGVPDADRVRRRVNELLNGA